MAMQKRKAAPAVNAEFDLDLGDTVVQEPKASAAFIDPELDRDNWPIILIEMEEGKPNYEFIASHGTMKNGEPFDHDMQIMRGVEVAVPPSIVDTLRCSVATHHVPRRNPETNRIELVRQDRSAVPWRLVKGGKYC